MNFSSGKSAAPVPDFIFVGEHPAVDFVNTLALAQGAPLDFFAGWADVVRWLVAAKLAAADDLRVPPAQRESATKRVIELRRAWKIELEKIAAGKAVSDAFADELNALLAEDSFHEVLHRHGKSGFHLARSASKVSGGKRALAILARQIAHFLAEANPDYVRRCANHDSCVLYFYDTTKNHRRQWCSAATCGNRHKVAEFRKRLSRGKN
jgi:predicted RNA-binding Zn ribbon-like protein